MMHSVGSHTTTPLLLRAALGCSLTESHCALSLLRVRDALITAERCAIHQNEVH